VMGVGLARVSARPAAHLSLSDELGLTAQQREQMKEIWSKVVERDGTGGSAGDRRAALRKDRDEAIAKLIPEDQKAAFEKIQQDYTTALDALNKERSKVYQDAVERTKQILDAAQRVKYDEVLKRRAERGRGPRPR